MTKLISTTDDHDIKQIYFNVVTGGVILTHLSDSGKLNKVELTLAEANLAREFLNYHVTPNPLPMPE